METLDDKILIHFLLEVGEARCRIKELLVLMETKEMEGTEDWCTELYNIYCKLHIGEPDV